MRPLSLALFCILPLAALGQSMKPYEGMKWRLVGPFRGGRSVACVGSQQRPDEYYFGATGGGIWKSTDSGENWHCVSDGFLNTSSVGALAIDPTNPDVVYAGTGERDIRGDISIGDGVYKSTDAGKSWTHIGLKECDTISRIVVDPKNPQNIYVAAFGHVYVKRNLDTGKVTADPNRGVYKSTDGGQTWTRVLYRNEVSGAVDLCIDPSDPQTLYAALWEAWRTPYMLNSGGPGSGLFKTTDGGKNWTEITRAPGLPSGMVGKIGVSVSPVNPKRVWAHIEALDGGIYRSDDGGATFQKTNESRNYRQRAWYYTHIYADTKDQDKVYVLNVGAGRSTDGGKTFSGIRTPHGDNHDLWIAPDNPQRMIESNDGGAAVTKDGGQTWTELDIPTGQFYHVSTDNFFPYRILGAQQDNSTVRIFSRTEGTGIAKTDWTGTAGGESGYVAAKPDDPDIVYGGNYGNDLERMNHRTGRSRQVSPWPDNPMGHPASDLAQRFQWTYPIVFSPHNPNLLYTCSQFVQKSTDSGEHWTKISGDLTRNDKRTLISSGGPITKDNTSVEYYGTVFTVAESPVKAGVIWAGSDDGLVHVTRNGGGSWQNVTPKEMPDWGLCSMIDPSPFDPATAYLAVDNHENDDYAPYVFVTHDFGKTWQKMTDGIGKEAFVRVVREDPGKPGLLFCGTESGLYVSFDAGRRWQRFEGNLPLCPVHDLTFKDGDLVVATHGRAFWVLDDLAPLHDAAVSLDKPYFFQPGRAYRLSWGGRGDSSVQGQNPLSGFVVNYYLPKKASKLSFEIIDKNGTSLATSESGPTEEGFNRWSLSVPRYPSYKTLPGLILWGAFASPIQAPPGDYKIKITVDGWSDTKTVKLVHDPREECSDSDLMAQFELAVKVRDRVSDLHEALAKVRDAKKKVDAAKEKTPDLAGASDALNAKLSVIEEDIYQEIGRAHV